MYSIVWPFSDLSKYEVHHGGSKFEYYLFYAKRVVHQYGFTGFRLSNQYVEIMPIPIVTSQNGVVVAQIEDLVDTIISIKKRDSLKDTSRYEQ